ncbi:MAG: hypothetical protein JW951_00310, partial [Lentisphaerae bacterium]|nr:hypothetical protein [Lentisphaerota bacterium]
IRVLAAARQLRTVELSGDRLILVRGSDYLKTGSRFPRIQSTTPDSKLDEILRHLSGMKA